MYLGSSKPCFNLFYRYMTQKLFALANDKCAPESPDNPMNQEILLGGHVYLLVLKVRTVLFHSAITSISNGFHDIAHGVIFSSNLIDPMRKCFFTRNNQFDHSIIIRKTFRPKIFQTIVIHQ